MLPGPAREDPVALTEVLERELELLHGGSAPAPSGGSTDERLAAVFRAVHALEPKRTALCLSGGGIRSATFALGLVQGLASRGLLADFHYLSTVSGGGYLGSWLSAWIQSEGSIERVQARLAGEGATVTAAEPYPLENLRAYSNYLTPRLGILSTDTWAIIATVLRNLILNWLLLTPILAAAVLLPGLWRLLLPLQLVPAVPAACLGLAAALYAVVLAYPVFDMPSLGNARRPQRDFVLFCLAPLLTSVLLAATAWVWRPPAVDIAEEALTFALCGGLFHALVLAAAAAGRRRWIGPGFYLVAVALGALGGLGLWALATKVFPRPGIESDSLVASLSFYVVAAPGVALLLVVLLGALFVGLTSRMTQDGDREWFSRAGGWVLIAVCVWTVGAGLAIFGPALPGWIKTLIGSSGGVAGAVTALLAYRDRLLPAREGKEGKSWPLALDTILLPLAATAFVLALVVVASIGSAALVKTLTGGIRHFVNQELFAAFMSGVGVCVGLALFSVLMSPFVDINDFSLHAMYRNRLVRAYLGARRRADARQDANPFTGLAASDDLPMTALVRNRLFHVLNLTLNLVAPNRLAWQERRAESFTVSPLHCGSQYLGYRPSARYAASITLGTAATISGAAASPNMGYHSSPAITFLMTFFNARLGCWLGNPGTAGWPTWFLRGPITALAPILAEAFGRTDDRSRYAYLSDGGHFENLGLYEMVLRRCHLILVSDAGSDSMYSFGDLGNAVRKIRIDLGIPIVFRGRTLTQTVSGDEGKYGAVADILYSQVDEGGVDGLLVYLKPSLNGTEPPDIRNYKAKHPVFPHESTADQWFSESQFESYRVLGAHVISQISGTVWGSLEAFARQAESYLGPPPPINPRLRVDASPEPERS